MSNTTTYTVTGMSCAACAARLTKALAPFARDVTVTLDPPRAILTDASANLAMLNEAAQKVGDYRLLAADMVAATPVETPKGFFATYRPLLLIVGYIALASCASSGWMLNFMAGFFLVFSFFKLLDVRGFADSYRMYDLLAARVPAYARVYPYLELALGFAYLFRIALPVTLWLTLLLMAFGSLGVIRALLDKKQIRCACLGTALNLPLSRVALIEDLGMAAMAAIMLVCG